MPSKTYLSLRYLLVSDVFKIAVEIFCEPLIITKNLKKIIRPFGLEQPKTILEEAALIEVYLVPGNCSSAVVYPHFTKSLFSRVVFMSIWIKPRGREKVFSSTHVHASAVPFYTLSGLINFTNCRFEIFSAYIYTIVQPIESTKAIYYRAFLNSIGVKAYGWVGEGKVHIMRIFSLDYSGPGVFVLLN